MYLLKGAGFGLQGGIKDLDRAKVSALLLLEERWVPTKSQLPVSPLDFVLRSLPSSLTDLRPRDMPWPDGLEENVGAWFTKSFRPESCSGTLWLYECRDVRDLLSRLSRIRRGSITPWVTLIVSVYL